MSTVRHILSMRSPRGERGAAAIMVAISLLMLLGVTALAIDGSSAYNDRRGSQNAADNAALAAAWQQCNPDTIGSTPENAARATAADNGYDDKNPDVTVTPTQVSAGVWEVKITKLQDGIFGQATPYAPDALTVVSQAVAECVVQEYLGNYALFAAAYGCSGDEISVTSSNIDVTGGVFSNEQITISGGGPGVTGDIINRDPSGGSDGTYDKGPPQKYPVDLDITDFRPGGTESSDPNYHAASGNIDSNWLVNNGYTTMVSGTPNLTVSGIYYSPGSITLIKGLTTNPGVKATFVAEKDIQMQQKVTLTGYANVVSGAYSPLALFANDPGSPSCNRTAIKFATSETKAITGLIFAPNGAVDMSGSTIEVNGSILAYRINASTSSLTVTWQDAPGAPDDFVVNLLE